MTDEFSVYWWDAEDNHHEELRFVGPEQALKAAMRLSRGPGAQLGMVRRVIITDGGDYCNWEWREGRIIFDGRDLPDANAKPN